MEQASRNHEQDFSWEEVIPWHYDSRPLPHHGCTHLCQHMRRYVRCGVLTFTDADILELLYLTIIGSA
uniref:Uncharacterized protein n=1 Tax=Rhizophora mucronata TaxID=61149 RepID=A0A2P2Q9F9_RHIMU